MFDLFQQNLGTLFLKKVIFQFLVTWPPTLEVIAQDQAIFRKNAPAKRRATDSCASTLKASARYQPKRAPRIQNSTLRPGNNAKPITYSNQL